MQSGSMDSLLAKLSEQQVILEKQKIALSSTDGNTTLHEKEDSGSSSLLLTPATDTFSNASEVGTNDEEDTLKLDAAEMLRLKKELEAAKDHIARQKHELDQTRVIQHTLHQALGSSETETIPQVGTAERAPTGLHPAFNGSARPLLGRQDNWGHNEDNQSDVSDTMSAAAFSAAQNIWSTSTRPGLHLGLPATTNHFQQPTSNWGQAASKSWNSRATSQMPPALFMPQQHHMQQRAYSGPSSPIANVDGRFANEFSPCHGNTGLRRPVPQNNHSGMLFNQNRNNGWDMYSGGVSTADGINRALIPASPYQSVGLFQAPMAYHPRPIGTPLSPTAAEFTTNQPSLNPWNAAVSSELKLCQI